MKLNELTISKAKEGLKEKQFSCVDLVKSCLDRIKAIDNKVKAFITVCNEQALTEAKQADELIKKDTNIFDKKPLLGIPVAIKDNFCTKGIKTTAASKVLENFIPPYNATVVEKLKKAGAIIIGKTNMDAWAHGSSTEASDFFTTHNPWNLKRLPGGSSGGSAAAVASDECIFGIGTETAGSIKQPSSWCGVTGFKPTYGRVSRYGVISMCSSSDSPGPITKTVEDAAIVLQTIAGKDKYDATSSSNIVPDYIKELKDKNQEKIKVGIPKEYFIKGMDKETENKVKEAIKIFAQNNFRIIPVSLIDPKYSIAIYTIIQRSEVSSNLANDDGIRYGNNRSYFGEEAKRRIMLGTYTLSSGYYDQYYIKAQKARTLLLEDFKRIFKEVDILIAPTTPTPALPLGATTDQAMFGEMQDILVEAASLSGLPGVNLPCGFNKTGLPIGMQLIGPQFSEDLLFRVGHFYQNITEWHVRKPKIDG